MQRILLLLTLLFFLGESEPRLYANGGGQSDTLTICLGESVQLQTTPNDESYLWTPNVDISNTTIFNPIVSPTQTTTYYVEVRPPSDFNFVTNGDFEQGNLGVQSDYNYTATSTFEQGFYGIFNNPQQFNFSFGACQDHTPGVASFMMVVDGATILNENVWCQTIDVFPGRTYDFSAWITNVHPTEPSELQFSINGALLGNSLPIDEALCVWEEFSAQWYVDCEPSATICITNQSTIAIGNDFAIDDISFTFSEAVYTDTFTVIVLPTSSSEIDTMVCENGSFVFAGGEVSAGEDMDFYFTAFNGCDSIVSVSVGILDTFYFEERVDTLCAGESLLYQGITITQDTAICDVYTNALGCDSTFCFVVYFLTEATIAVTAESPTCGGFNDGSLLAEPFAGLPPYQYLWSNGATSSAINNLPAGTYVLTVTDAKNCIAIKTMVLEEPPELSLDLTISNVSCFGDEDGSVSYIPGGGTPGYTLIWEGGIPNGDSIEGLSAGTYSLLLEDSDGCQLQTPVTIGSPNPIVVSTILDTTILLGQNIDLNTSILSDLPYTFVWSPTVDLDCFDCESPGAMPLESRDYFLSVVNENGCEAVTSFRVEVVKNYQVYIPNVFSPNFDGWNDEFEIYTGADVAEVEQLTIYNRWGAVVFEQENCQPGTRICAWDGTFRGQDAETGVYVYVAKVKFIDEEVKVFAGDVLVLR